MTELERPTELSPDSAAGQTQGSPPDQASAGPATEHSTVGFFDSLYSVLFRPRAALPATGAARIPIHYGLVIMVLTSLLEGARQSFIDLPLASTLGGWAVVVYTVGSLIITVVLWVGTGAVVAAGLELLGGEGRIKELLAWQGMAHTPRLFQPLALGLSSRLPAVSAVLTITIALWTMILYVMAGRSVYRISAGRSFAASFIWPGTLLVFGMIGLTLIAMMIGLSIGIPDLMTLLP